MKIGIIGGGAIGLLLSYYFSQQGHLVTVYVQRDSQRQQLNEYGVMVSTLKSVHVSAKSIKELEAEDLMFICTKQEQLRDLWSVIREISCPLIFIQNGMSHIDMLKNRSPKEMNVMVATIEHGAKRVNDYTVSHNGFGRITMAVFSGNVNALQQVVTQLHHAHFPIYIHEDWYSMLAQKLVINAVINPITAIFQVKNGEVVNNSYLTKLSKQLCKEAAQVLSLNENDMWDKVRNVAVNTANNDSSMKLDIVNRNRTEIEAILGYLRNHAKTKIPYIDFAYNGVKAIESHF